MEYIRKKLNKNFAILLSLLLLAFLLRVAIFSIAASYPQHPDTDHYKRWAVTTYLYGFADVYKTNNLQISEIATQPPGTVFILRGTYEAYLLISKSILFITQSPPGTLAWVNDGLLYFFLRLPSIIADIIIGALIYWVVIKKKSFKMALYSSAFFLFNPAIIYNSAVWGQTDSINNMFLYLSIVLFIFGSAYFSIFSFTMSLFVKLSLLPLAPLFFLFTASKRFFSRISFIKASVLSFVMVLVLSLPFSSNPTWIFNTIYKISQGESNQITVNAFNFWWFILKPQLFSSTPAPSSIFMNMSLDFWAYFLFIIFLIPLLIASFNLVKNHRISEELIFLIFALSAFAAFMFLPKMHERYLYPVIPLIITWAGLKNKLWTEAILVSMICFFNMYLVWHPTLILTGPLLEFSENQNTVWFLSLCLLLIFAKLYFETYKQIKYAKKNVSI